MSPITAQDVLKCYDVKCTHLQGKYIFSAVRAHLPQSLNGSECGFSDTLSYRTTGTQSEDTNTEGVITFKYFRNLLLCKI